MTTTNIKPRNLKAFNCHRWYPTSAYNLRKNPKIQWVQFNAKSSRQHWTRTESYVKLLRRKWSLFERYFNKHRAAEAGRRRTENKKQHNKNKNAKEKMRPACVLSSPDSFSRRSLCPRHYLRSADDAKQRCYGFGLCIIYAPVKLQQS